MALVPHIIKHGWQDALGRDGGRGQKSPRNLPVQCAVGQGQLSEVGCCCRLVNTHTCWETDLPAGKADLVGH